MTTAAAAAALARAARARMGDDSRSPRRTATGSSSRTTLSRSSTCASATAIRSGSSRTSARSARSTVFRFTRCSRSVGGLCRVSSVAALTTTPLVSRGIAATGALRPWRGAPSRARRVSRALARVCVASPVAAGVCVWVSASEVRPAYAVCVRPPQADTGSSRDPE